MDSMRNKGENDCENFADSPKRVDHRPNNSLHVTRNISSVLF